MVTIHVHHFAGVCAILVLHILVADAGTCPAQIEEKTDFLNEDGQTSAPAASIDECCSLCQNQGGCMAFTWRSDQKRCWMKSDASNPQPNENATSGYLGKPLAPCLGEFTMCPSSGECSMGPCGACTHGQYLCPSDQKTCVDSAADYINCPMIKGTHLDWTLSEEERLDYLVNRTNITDQIAQLTNKAPAMPQLGIPSYNWLNDDQHGVGRTSAKATVLPNGCGMGATWDKAAIRNAGRVVGVEARGLHDYFLHSEDNRGENCNGCGITAYAPNLNLVKDPRWGRAQEVFGEDPYHMSQLVINYVTGAQDNAPGSSVGPDGKHLQIGMCCTVGWRWRYTYSLSC